MFHEDITHHHVCMEMIAKLGATVTCCCHTNHHCCPCGCHAQKEFAKEGCGGCEINHPE